MISAKPTILVTAVGLLLSLSARAGDSRQLTVTINAVDQRGIPIEGLRRENFKAKSHRHNLQVASLAFADGPRRIVVLLDTSGSMSGAEIGGDKWAVARDEAREFITTAPPKARLSLLTFADKVEERSPLSEDRRRALEWLGSSAANRKSVKGPTCLYEAILAGLKELDPPQPGDAIFAVTDGGENSSKARFGQVANPLRASGVRLYTFLLPETVPLEGRENLLEMVRESGGFEVELYPSPIPVGAPPAVDLRAEMLARKVAYDDRVKSVVRASAYAFNQQIRSFYLLTLSLPDKLAKPRDWNLELVDQRGRNGKDAILTYPGHLMPVR
jgi:hypothetical protein